MPLNECVYCDIEFDDIADHHFEEHPDQRWNPAWYDFEPDWPVVRTVYVNDEHADRPIREELYDEPKHVDRRAYEIEMEFMYHEDGIVEMLSVEGCDLE